MAERIGPISLSSPPQMQVEQEAIKRAPIKTPHAAPITQSPKTYEPSKPKLAPPSIGKSLSKFIDNATDQQTKIADHNLEQIRRLTERMGKLELDKIHHVSQKAKEAFECDTWDFYKQVAYCLSSATSIIVGGSLCATGQAPLIYLGGSLIGSGIGTISAQFLEKQGVSKEICGAIALASAALGIVGSAGGMMYTPGEMTKLIRTIISAVATLTSGVTQYKVNDAQANMQEIESMHSKIQHELQQLGVESDASMNETGQSLQRLDGTRAIQNAARDYNEAVTEITGRMIAAAAG
ncbi:MAG: hypothetical protein P0S94_03430 [Simkaniaceae bacterium]|nr:hypothetical protein [Simkaniaceae bacterium]